VVALADEEGDMARPGDRSAVVLVHGAWHGAWCWDRVVGPLRDAGIEVVAIDLPGHGADPGPLGDLHGDAARLRGVLDSMDAPVVLLGHSYGGAVITEAGDHPSVAHLVYLCALAVDADETCATAGTGDPAPADISHKGRIPLASTFVPSADGTAITVTRDGAAALLYNDCDAESTEWALARLGPQPAVSFQQTPDAVAWRSKPSTYVVCANDQTIHPDLQRILARRCTTSVEWPTGHSPFLCRPELVVDLLTALARSPGE
jgi:pimeloyl-ACP methyl ester carboxylesterase